MVQPSANRLVTEASLPELTRDVIGSTLVAGPNVVVTVSDVNDTITIGVPSTAAPTVSDATTTTKGVVQLAGVLAGTASAPTLAPTGVGAQTIGSATAIPVLTLTADGRVAAVGTAAPTAGGTAATSDAVSVSAYAPKADGLYGPASITSGAKTLTFPAGGFVAGHVGAYVRVAGAGASGATLVTSITAVGSGTSVTVSDAAGTTVSGAQMVAGNSNYGALANALAAGTGRKVTVPKGVYYLHANVPLPADTELDATGATFLFGGFYLDSRAALRNGKFVGDGSGDYNLTVSCYSASVDDITVENNTFFDPSWAIFQGSIGFNRRWKVRGNKIYRARSGGMYIAGMLDSAIENNWCIQVPAGTRPFEFFGPAQRNRVAGNHTDGGRVGILFLWDPANVPTPTATQSIEVCDNVVAENYIANQTEEGISFDGGNTFDNATVSAVSGSGKTVTVTGTGWSSAGSRYLYYWLYVMSGSGIGQLHRITAHAAGTFTLGDADTLDLAKIAAGDSVVICQPTHHNEVVGNRVDGRSSSTFSIWLYSSCHFNVVSDNRSEGAPIGLAGTNSMAAISGSVSGAATSSPSSNNVFAHNICTNARAVTNYYNQVPGLNFLYFNFGAMTDFYMVGNLAQGNIVRGGVISLNRQEKLLSGNVCDRALVNTSPFSGSTVVTGI